MATTYYYKVVLVAEPYKNMQTSGKVLNNCNVLYESSGYTTAQTNFTIESFPTYSEDTDTYSITTKYNSNSSYTRTINASAVWGDNIAGDSTIQFSTYQLRSTSKTGTYYVYSGNCILSNYSSYTFPHTDECEPTISNVRFGSTLGYSFPNCNYYVCNNTTGRGQYHYPLIWQPMYDITWKTYYQSDSTIKCNVIYRAEIKEDSESATVDSDVISLTATVDGETASATVCVDDFWGEEYSNGRTLINLRIVEIRNERGVTIYSESTTSTTHDYPIFTDANIIERYYKLPTLSCNVKRVVATTHEESDDGQSLRFDFSNTSYSPIIVDEKQYNTAQIDIAWTSTEESGSATIWSSSDSTVIPDTIYYDDNTFEDTHTYDLTVTLTESCYDGSAQTVTTVIPYDVPIMDVLSGGNGIAFGKMASQDGVLESAWDIQAPNFGYTEGSGTYWNWRKWNNGLLEMWRTSNNTVACTTSAGNMYCNANVSTPPDFDAVDSDGNAISFTDVPNIQVSMYGTSNYLSWIARAYEPSTTNCGGYYIMRPTSTSSRTYYADWYCRGKWK